jgi:hypothetical protein
VISPVPGVASADPSPPTTHERYAIRLVGASSVFSDTAIALATAGLL